MATKFFLKKIVLYDILFLGPFLTEGKNPETERWRKSFIFMTEKERTKMKKILSVFLALLMVVLLVGCGIEEASNVDDVTNPAKAKISKGTIEGDVYKNDFLGFSFTKPATWVYSTDEEIAEVMNVAVDQILGENFEKAMENNPATYDMMVVDMMTGTNVNLVYENLKKSFATNITEAQYFELFKQQLENVEGITVSFSDDLKTVTLGETVFTKCVCETTMNGQTMTQIFYVSKNGGYMVIVTATITSGYTADEIEAMFR